MKKYYVFIIGVLLVGIIVIIACVNLNKVNEVMTPEDEVEAEDEAIMEDEVFEENDSVEKTEKKYSLQKSSETQEKSQIKDSDSNLESDFSTGTSNSEQLVDDSVELPKVPLK